MARPKATNGIGIFIRKQLLTASSYTKILEQAQKKFPESLLALSNIRWYAWKMRKEKIKLPPRHNSTTGK